MRLISISIVTLLLLTLKLSGQTRTIAGKVISEDLTPVSQVSIQNSGRVLLGTTDNNGQFKIEIPVNTTSLLVGSLGSEWASIGLTDSCELDIILMNSANYDFITLKKVDKLRMKRFKKLPGLHLSAYKKGIFTTDKSCYKQNFIRSYKPNKT